MPNIRKRKRKDREQLAFDLDAILTALEESFIIKLSKYFTKLTNNLAKKIDNLPVFKKAINQVDKKDVEGLKTLFKKYYIKVGKETVKQTNKEISELSGKSSKIKIPDINEGLRYRAEQLAIKKIKDFNRLIKGKVLAGDGTKKDKAELIKKLKSTQNVYINRHVVIVARMESVTVANQQRLEAFKKSTIIKGVQFLAVLDKRTTDICRSRHSMVLKLSDPLLPNFRPPCHFGCRSLLSGVTIFEEIPFTALDKLKTVPDKDFGKSADTL